LSRCAICCKPLFGCLIKSTNIITASLSDGSTGPLAAWANRAWFCFRSAIRPITTPGSSSSEDKGRLPERVDVSTLQNYRSFKQIDNEGKYLFDFVTAGVWNARTQMVEWLRGYYDHHNEVVDLFCAITRCHGWVRSTAEAVTVRLEPLQQPKRRAAQEQLCRKLTALGAQTPLGKRLVLEMGQSPL